MYVLAALVAAAPSSAVAGAVVTAAISAPAGDVPAGTTVQVRCWAEGQPTGGMSPSTTTIGSVAVTVSGGSVAPAQLTGAVSAPCSYDATKKCSLLQGSVAWTTAASAGSFTATCTAAYTTTRTFGGPVTGVVAAVAPLTTVEAAALPPVVGAMSGPALVVAGSTSAFAVGASDPNSPALPLAYAWTATGGTIEPDAADPAQASWRAPATQGVYELAAIVSNGVSSIEARRSVSVVLASHQAGLPVSLAAPRRLAAGEAGALFAIDGQQGALGQVALLTPRGEPRGFSLLPEPALSVASGAGLLWVTTTRGNVYKLDPTTGRTVGKLSLAGGPFVSPSGIAYDAASMTLWVADAAANRVRLITPDGATVAVIDGVEGAPLAGPVDVAIDAAGGKAWVLVGDAKAASAVGPGESIAPARFLHSFDLSGRHLGSYAARGGALGEVTRAGGLAVDAQGRVYVSDVFQGTIQVFATTGTPIGTIGAFGEAAGELMNPTGLAVMGNGDLAVANTTRSKVERFGTGVALPTCEGDSDCDGLPDAWELANGLDPSWAGDALVDLDGDGLTNVEEYAAGTNPRSADTDGDGYADADELLAGWNPTVPEVRTPVLSVSAPAEVGPGLVRLSAVASGAGTCGFSWTQASGPPVSLRSAATAAPSFVARVAGTYELDAVATCGAASSAPARVTVAVRNVPPAVDAGGVLVAHPGDTFRLDALGSSDANGDALGFAWEQTLGVPLVGTEAGGALEVKPRGVGLYAFQVTAKDPAGAVATAEVPVLVAAGPAPTAIAAALPSSAEVGAPVVLDAGASLAERGAAFAWRQVAGPPAALSAPDRAVASFVPAAAGRHVFEVSVGSGRLRSPPARVEVFVAEAGVALPSVAASAASIVEVGTPVSLEAVAGTSAAVEYAWRQVSGPAAGLSEADRASATAVAFVPGFYVFEVSVKAGAAESRPARVAFEARAAGAAIPRARAVAAPAGEAWVEQLVWLDGRESTGAARFRWTQVGGPWVAIDAGRSLTSFRPLVPGVYAFELVVDDGTVRSAPAHVEVRVVEGVR